MSSTTFLRSAVLLFSAILAVSATASDDHPLFHSTNPLAPRDEWGVLHQMPNVDPTDYFHRSGSRLYYYFKSRQELLRDPAYVAYALWINEHGLLAWLGRVAPILRYAPPNR